jgi:hypothetical protein
MLFLHPQPPQKGVNIPDSDVLAHAPNLAIHPAYAIFSKTPVAFRFLKRIENTVLHGVHLTPTHHPKIAAFDLDETLIRTKSGGPYPRGEHDWKWLYAAIPVHLKGLHDEW